MVVGRAEEYGIGGIKDVLSYSYRTNCLSEFKFTILQVFLSESQLVLCIINFTRWHEIFYEIVHYIIIKFDINLFISSYTSSPSGGTTPRPRLCTRFNPNPLHP